MKSRRGFTLAEMLVTMVVMGIVGSALAGLFASQSRFYDHAGQSQRARYVAQTALNAVLSDLRMVEATGGVVSPTTTEKLTVDVPYAMGILCAKTGAATVALFPIDPLVADQAKFAGFAWRDDNGSYSYVRAADGAALGTGMSGTCLANGVSLVSGGSVATVSSAVPAGADVGDPVLLLQRITYEFKASNAMPGRIALWRTIAGGQSDELVGPFSNTAGFRFFVDGDDQAKSSVPSPLSSIRGVEIHFDSESDRAPRGSDIRTAELVTAVFFNNVMR
jgi:prepilin-type N-terminal cleavage/methylation domain-containing protein